MIVSVDDELCGGHGVCCAIAPDMFVLTDDGYAKAVAPGVAEDREDAAVEAARRCPNRAITITPT